MSVFGTRPEVIKMAPVIKELEARGIPHFTCVTGQHREMLHQALGLFDIKPDFDLAVMTDNQTLESVTAKVLMGLHDIYAEAKPDVVLVQGDTNSAFSAALAAFYQKIPVGHVEAGLRTNNQYDPFPEEMMRRLITPVAALHFAPTRRALDNLLAEGIDPATIHVTGNTVIDAMFMTLDRQREFEAAQLRELKLEERAKTKRLILLAVHRRENLGARMENIFRAVRRLAQEQDCEFIFPIHPNPNVRAQAKEMLAGVDNIHIIEPVDYADYANLVRLSYFVMTDSGGIQEDAPALDKPVLVLRETTERGEGIDAGTAMLAGGEDEELIYSLAKRLLTDERMYRSMAEAPNPYGDGSASRKIVDWVESYHRGGRA